MRNPFKDLPQHVGELHTSPIIRRHEGNPILTSKDVPYPATYVFNAGVNRYHGKYYIAPRVDLFNGRERPALDMGTGFGVSDDGIHFEMMPDWVRVHYKGVVLPWLVDSRLTVLEDQLYLTFCFENQHSERPGIARWRGEGVDFDAVCIGIPQQRNMVLFPEKVNGMYMRLERPSNQWHDPFSIWYAFSPDLRYWGDQELYLGCEDVPWANRKIGAAAPPIKTDRGWLLLFHAVDFDADRHAKCMATDDWQLRYTVGAALFSPEDPTKLIAITKQPILVAEAPYETGPDAHCWVENTIFPCGAVLEDDQNTLRIYYGSGDNNTCLAFTTLKELWTVMSPATRLADTATVHFRYEKWQGNPQ